MVHAVDFGQARLGGLIGRVYPRKHRTDLPRLRIVHARPPRLAREQTFRDRRLGPKTDNRLIMTAENRKLKESPMWLARKVYSVEIIEELGQNAKQRLSVCRLLGRSLPPADAKF